MKGNGTPHDSNTFEVYTSNDSSAWNLLVSMDSISPSAAIISLAIPGSAQHVKFFYRKLVSGYNVGLDDIAVLKNSGVGIAENGSVTETRIFPTPTTGLVTVLLPSSKNADIAIYDLLGNALKNVTVEKNSDKKITVNLTGQKPGFYFLRIKTNSGIVTKRVTLQ